MPRPDKYTASFAFFESLYEAGISHVFVNLGSDHPAIMEALAMGDHFEGVKFPQIITCPHEFVAMAMADGFARLTGQPQCVLVHVDVGTQMLGCGMHNSSRGRSPVFVFAGLSPFTQEGELRGSRTEYIHWLQDAHDQKAIVSQYCRYAGEFRTGRNIKQMVNRALQFATSDPKGPVYMVGAREVMEEEIDAYSLDYSVWQGIGPAALPQKGVEEIVKTLVQAESALILTGYSGRNHASVAELVKLVESIPGVRVLDGLGSDVCFPYSHRASLGNAIGIHPAINQADVILVLDCDVTWIPTQCRPRPDARIIHIDVDPLKEQMPLYYISAEQRYRADAFTALQQLNKFISESDEYTSLATKEPYTTRWAQLAEEHKRRLDGLAMIGARPADSSAQANTSYLCAQLRKVCPRDTLWCLEAVTNARFLYEQLQVDEPGHIFGNGGGGLGWSGGASIGIKLAADWLAGGPGKGSFLTQIVGDGTFMFSVPGTVYWVARRYQIPTLTVVLGNKGWNAPRNSLQLVHPTGYGSKVSNKELNISFDPTPDLSGIAKAAAGGNAWAGVASTVEELDKLLPEAVQQVQGGLSAILEVRIQGIEAITQ